MLIKDLSGKLWEDNHLLFGMLKESATPEIARDRIDTFISGQWKIIYRNEEINESLELSIQTNALRVLRKLVSIRSEKLTGFSFIKLMWHLANENYDRAPEDINEGFFEEIKHLLKAIHGKAGIYHNEKHADFTKSEGQRAAILRSDFLNNVADSCNSYIKKYPHGLLEEVKTKRLKNKDFILNQLGGTESDWNDYKWHLKNVIRDSDSLEKLINLTDDEKKAIKMAKELNLPFGITPYYASLMDKNSSRKNDHAVRAQVIPPNDYVETMAQYRGDTEYSADFMLERDTSPENLITRRYPFIAIFKPYNTCAQICVYCQRNWQITDVMDPNAMSKKDEMERAYQWFENNPEVEEILITGGDPFIMSTSRIKDILDRVCSMKHIKRIRFGTRTPVVLPHRIDEELAETIASYHIPGEREVAIITHFEHVYEITPEAMEAVQRFKKRGLSIYNQAVFTFENSRKFELVALRILLRSIGVDSYYTFNTKGKEETNSYRVPLARLEQEVKEEARLAPGLVRTDEPVYNVPKLGKNYIRAAQHHSLLTILPDGKRMYEFHPWEKNLSYAKTYIDTDVSIYEYMNKLKRQGENLDDYMSIWYYY